jgi:hypothetical protein
VDGGQVGVLEETDQVGLGGFLESKDGRSLESQVSLELLGDFTDKSLEWELSDQELSRLLVTSDFSESDGTWSVSVRLLDTSSRWGGLAGSLGGQLLTRSPGGEMQGEETICENMFGREVVRRNDSNEINRVRIELGSLAKFDQVLRRGIENTHFAPVDLRAVCLVRAISDK